MFRRPGPEGQSVVWVQPNVGRVEMLDLPREDMPEMPRHVQLPEGTGAATELLKVLLKLVADKEGVAAKMLASGDDLDRIAAHGEEADVAALSGWRREVFGEQALKLVRGELGLKFDKRRIRVFETEGKAAAE